MHFVLTRSLIIPIAAFFIIGCSQSTNHSEVKEVSANDASAQRTPADDETILAWVNDTPITDLDLQSTIDRSLGAQGEKLDENGRRKVLGSLVAGRAMALIGKEEMDAKTVRRVEREVRAYKEQLLMQVYLSNHMPLEALTFDAIKNYYDSHPEQFGGGERKTVEMIQTLQEMDPPERNRLISDLKNSDSYPDWTSWTAELRKRGYPVTRRIDTLQPDLLEPELARRIGMAEKGAPAATVMAGGNVYLFRVLDIKTIPGAPLESVKDSIRKKLEPTLRQKALRKASEEVLEKVAVRYAADS